MGWGLAWIAVGRLQGEPASRPIGITAAVVAVVVIAVPVVGTLANRVIEMRNAEA